MVVIVAAVVDVVVAVAAAAAYCKLSQWSDIHEMFDKDMLPIVRVVYLFNCSDASYKLYSSGSHGDSFTESSGAVMS